MKHAKNVDAKDRANRTFWQGMIVAIALAVSAVVIELVGAWSHTDVLSGGAWLVLATSGVQAALTAVASYTQRQLETRVEINGAKVRPYEEYNDLTELDADLFGGEHVENQDNPR